MRLRTRIILLTALMLIIATVLFGVATFREQRSALLSGIDDKLLATARLAREILPADYHDKISGADSVSEAEYRRIVERWDRLCQQMGLEYIWSLMLIDGKTVFTSGSSTSKDVRKGDFAKFFETHSNPELYTAAFATQEPQYQINEDKWGRIRVVLLSFKDARGRACLFGASMKTTAVDALLLKTVWQSLEISVGILSLGVLLSVLLGSSLVRPLETLTDLARDITDGNWGRVIETEGAFEIQSLAHSVNVMSQSIEEKITERQRVEEELKRSDEALKRQNGLLSALLDNLPVAVFMVEAPSGKPLVANEAACRLLGRGILPDASEQNLAEVYKARKLGCRDPYPLDELPILRGMRGEAAHVDDMVVDRPDGSETFLEVFGTPVTDGQGQIWASLVSFLDITERKKMEEALRESETKFRSLFENMSEGVGLHEMIRDASGRVVDYRILETNPAYGKHTGLPPDRAQGILASALYGTTPPPYLDEFGRVARTGEPFAFETYFEGLEKYFSISVVSPKPGQFATVFEDITERRRKEKELQEKNEELARFTYTVSHDLKSPLVTILTFLGYLEQDIRKQDLERTNKDIGYIHGAANKMSRLLDEVLELSRIGRKTNPAVESSLQALVREAQDLVAGQIVERGVRVDVTSEPVWINGDRSRLVEVFQNLLDNAVKFMGEQPTPRVAIGVESGAEGMIFFVRDNGKGIDPRHQGKLFGLFEKLDPSAPGTGIGLALVRRIVEVHGGKVWVESEGSGLGATFRFTLAKTRRGVK